MSTVTYEGNYYAEIGNFLKEKYLEYGFTKGTEQEVQFLYETFNLQRGMSLLDIGCGPGRHALNFARKGIKATGIDICSEFIELAQQMTRREWLSAQFQVMDAREMTFNQEFDTAICLCEGAFGLAGSEEDHRKVLRGIHQALKPAGWFALTAMHALSVARHANKNRFDPYTSTYIERETLMNTEGEMKDVELYTTAFTARELKWILEEEGFEVEGLYGCTVGAYAKRRLLLEDVEILALAKKK